MSYLRHRSKSLIIQPSYFLENKKVFTLNNEHFTIFFLLLLSALCFLIIFFPFSFFICLTHYASLCHSPLPEPVEGSLSLYFVTHYDLATLSISRLSRIFSFILRGRSPLLIPPLRIPKARGVFAQTAQYLNFRIFPVNKVLF